LPYSRYKLFYHVKPAKTTLFHVKNTIKKATA